MPYIYENDPTKIGTNLQTAVAYLLTLHRNEYEWNLLGIKVVGVKEALPIPDGTYDYGDAYMIGNEADSFEMWIYTRADEAHAEAYWFNVGAFPKPGPQGPKGDGWGTAQLLQEGLTTNLTYNSTNGGINESISSMTYLDSTTGQRRSQNFQMMSRLPIIPGKYVSMDATADNKAIKVKVDDTQLNLDYYKINKTSTSSVPAYSPTKGRTDVQYAFPETGNSLVQRGINGEAKFNWILANDWKKDGSPSTINFDDTVLQLYTGRLVVAKTTSNTGTLTTSQLVQLQRLPQLQLQYDRQTYYRMDPMTAPNGTINYIHIDSIDNGDGGYKATGKCFSVTVNTRAWKVFDLDFGGSTSASQIYRHGITMNDANIVVKLDIYNSNSQNYTYEQLKAKLALNPAHCATARIKRNDKTYYYSPATIMYWNDSSGNFNLTYNNTEGNNINVEWTPIVVSDNGTRIL